MFVSNCCDFGHASNYKPQQLLVFVDSINIYYTELRNRKDFLWIWVYTDSVLHNYIKVEPIINNSDGKFSECVQLADNIILCLYWLHICSSFLSYFNSRWTSTSMFYKKIQLSVWSKVQVSQQNLTEWRISPQYIFIKNKNSIKFSR